MKMNILVTLNEAYIPCLNVMLTSLLQSNPDARFDVYLLHTDIHEQALRDTRALLAGRGALLPIPADPSRLQDAPTTSRYPREMYYRIFAARYLPESLERVLYLDPDVIVNGRIDSLYAMPMENQLFAAASHVTGLMQKVNELRLSMDEDSPYINSGVLLMNLALLRREQDDEAVFDFIARHKNTLLLPDQDVISSLYGRRIIALDPYRYNMTERLMAFTLLEGSPLSLDWIRENTVIIHYCGRNKPWKRHYIGQLNCFYRETLTRMKQGLTRPEPEQ